MANWVLCSLHCKGLHMAPCLRNTDIDGPCPAHFYSLMGPVYSNKETLDCKLLDGQKKCIYHIIEQNKFCMLTTSEVGLHNRWGRFGGGGPLSSPEFLGLLCMLYALDQSNGLPGCWHSGPRASLGAMELAPSPPNIITTLDTEVSRS